MPKVTYVSPQGEPQQISAPAGATVMQAAVDNGVPGIIGECGGNCICATCHVYVREDFMGRLAPADSGEQATLEGAAAERKPNSRLGCQIRLTEALDGLTVTVPITQQ